MKKIYLAQVISAILTLLLFNGAWALTPEKISCKKIGNNTECVYKVAGQDIDNSKAMSKLYLNTNMPYALCASAKCTISKKDPNKAHCQCLVYGLQSENDSWQNASVGPLPYDAAKPIRSNNKISVLTSTYSMANVVNFSQGNVTACTSSNKIAWANCFGAKCQINQYGTSALCECPVVSTTSFVSVGPKSVAECNLPSGQVWSAATITQNANNHFIMRSYYQLLFDKNYQMR